MNSTPLVSIVIPVSGLRFLQAALESALLQTYPNIEVIVCDDSPTEEAGDIVRACAQQSAISLRYLFNPKPAGFTASLVNCLAQARGDFIKVLCDDDLIFAGCVASQAAVLRDCPEVTVVIGQRRFYDAHDVQLPDRLENTALAPVSAQLRGDDVLSALRTCSVNVLGGLSGALMRRVQVVDALKALAHDSVGYLALLDLALYVQLLKQGDLAVLNQVLSVERLHPQRLSAQPRVKQLAAQERQRLSPALKGGRGEQSQAPGWVRYRPLDEQMPLPVWKEFNLGRMLSSQLAAQQFSVGVTSESFAQVYEQWLACRHITDLDRASLPQALAQWPSRPTILVVVVDERAQPDLLKITLESLAKQLYAPRLTVVLGQGAHLPAADDTLVHLAIEPDWLSQLNQVIAQSNEFDWFYLLRAGDRLTESALLLLADRISHCEDVRCIYSDEGALHGGQSAEPIFKPDFNLDLMRSYPYVGRALAFERAGFVLAEGLDTGFGELAPHDLLWRIVESDGFSAIEHVSEVLLESTLSYGQWLTLDSVVEQNARVLAAHLDRMGVDHRLVAAPGQLINEIEYRHDAQPLVSILVTHKDQIAALQRCMDSVLEKTVYPHYELVIVDQGSVDPTAISWLQGMQALGFDKIRICHCQDEDSSAASARNYAASQTRGEYVLMLSPFAVITQSDWLDVLVSQAMRPEVGVVGAKIFEPQGTIVHAGLILGLNGPVGSLFAGAPMHSSGYMGRLHSAQNPSAMGPDCLMVRRRIFEEIDGLDQNFIDAELAAADLCLRVRNHGYMIVWTPRAVLALGEASGQSAESQLKAPVSADIRLFYQRWLSVIANDPAYNVNLQLKGASFAMDPGTTRPWRPIVDPRLPRVLAVPVNTTGAGHYRVAQPFKALESAALAVGHLEYGSLSLTDIARAAPDVIVIQGCYTRNAVLELELMVSCIKARFVYEIDDYVPSLPALNMHGKELPADVEELVRKGASLCDTMVVSTSPLAEALSSMHSDIRVVPNMLAPHLWRDVKSRRGTSKKPRVGWGGGTSHTGDLLVLAQVIPALASEVDWIFFGMCPEDLLPYVHEFHPPVSMQAYPAKLASLNLDLALAPLEFHVFNDCKSNLRLLEYGACAYPVICTDTKAYEGDLPCTRVIGNSPEEWLQAIRMHLDDPQTSYRMGDALRDAVMGRYLLEGDHLKQWVHGWLDA